MRGASVRSAPGLSGSGWGEPRWCRSAEGAELRVALGGDAKAKPVEPGARIEVLPARRGRRKRRAMGVSHDDEADRRLSREQPLCPGHLARGGISQCTGI